MEALFELPVQKADGSMLTHEEVVAGLARDTMSQTSSLGIFCKWNKILTLRSKAARLTNWPILACAVGMSGARFHCGEFSQVGCGEMMCFGHAQGGCCFHFMFHFVVPRGVLLDMFANSVSPFVFC